MMYLVLCSSFSFPCFTVIRRVWALIQDPTKWKSNAKNIGTKEKITGIGNLSL